MTSPSQKPGAGFHIPVMVDSVCRSLKIDQALCAIDATVGDGSYSLSFLQKMPDRGRVIGIDMDPDAIARAGERLKPYAQRFQAVRENFCNIDKVVSQYCQRGVDAIAADLGVSTLQITTPRKGFMFSQAGPLLMQMDPDAETSAAEIVNTYDEASLSRIFYNYGEERAGRRIAAAIVRARQKRKIDTTTDLADIVKGVVKQYQIKTLARIFQSLRIYLNKELENLESFLSKSVDILHSKGRLAVVSYHSLEDRKVKRFFQTHADPCTCPKELPFCVCGKKPVVKIVEKGLKPSAEEIERNRKARSARLRVAEKL